MVLTVTDIARTLQANVTWEMINMRPDSGHICVCKHLSCRDVEVCQLLVVLLLEQRSTVKYQMHWYEADEYY